ncbi:hypothetical protein OJF2_29230 [Aquisphaera giovannonii]|uniref:Glycosyltransferase RgtA/B/C/D-like domain-containing protein n=1 Tax=Aquisphaera giovannonii TaxID=406548 RepID=A0A5B9W2B3_9BACT|nr:hypothetical protein [Aquisphaera giovannonii]QEH34384.1 hypothetical protein OJF2_29230 [Aquisphaera giovannonii]
MVRARRFLPGPAEAVFGLVLLVILSRGRAALFNDPGTLWHYRLGRDILASGCVPRSDTLTYTRLGSPWVDQSWAFDAGLALVVARWGWPAAVAIAALLLAGVYAALTRFLIRDGTSPVIAAYVSIGAMTIGCIHFLIRPHLLTLALVLAAVRICQVQHERGGWVVAWVAPLTAILANIHGGFLALPGIVATAAAGHAVAGPWDAQRAGEVAKFALTFVACLLAALINPYGWGLYRHVGTLLVSSGVTSLIQEYAPVQFGQPNVQAMELAVVALIALPMLVNRRVDRYQLVHLLVWLHLSLTSVRNAPLFAIVAAFPLAALLDALPARFADTWRPGPEGRIWIPAMILGVALLVAAGVPLGTIDNGKWPVAALPSLDARPLAARLFHELEWGGLIESEATPRRLAYIDDRFELHGKPAVVEYAEALSGGPAWDSIRDREHIATVWIQPDRGLATRLGRDPGWRELYRDEKSVLYALRPGGAMVEATAWSGRLP